MRLLVTVLASYIFYMSWLPIYGLLLAAMTIANWLLGLGIESAIASSRKKLATSYLLVGLLINVGVLCYYKYFNFIFENAVRAVISAGAIWPQIKLSQSFLHLADSPFLSVVLPLGISFFVFEFVHYLSDVFRGHKVIPGLRQLRRLLPVANRRTNQALSRLRSKVSPARAPDSATLLRRGQSDHAGPL